MWKIDGNEKNFDLSPSNKTISFYIDDETWKMDELSLRHNFTIRLVELCRGDAN